MSGTPYTTYILMARYKTWTLDYELDYGLDYGLDYMAFALDNRTYNLFVNTVFHSSAINNDYEYSHSPPTQLLAQFYISKCIVTIALHLCK